ncbi:hypothetical protein ANDO1_1692 [plant metagenome]|uniref:Holin n=1 Tax=plant metagenome TaxID=1297885 RepID=A0A484QHX5_9ZZZZ
MQTEIASEATKATPPAAVAAVEALSHAGLGPVGWATIVYIALQAAYLLWKWRRDYLRDRNAGEAG